MADLDPLRDPDPEVRYAAACRLRPPLAADAVDLLLQMLSDEGRFEEDVGDDYGGPWYEARLVSDAAEEALARGADAAALRAPLCAFLERGSGQARRHAARLLARCPEARERLLDALADDDPRVREAALGSLLDMRPRTSPLDDEPLLRRILACLWDPDAEVSRAAAGGLERLSQHPRLPTLMAAADWRPRMASDGPETPRISACRALGLVPDDAAAASLLADVLRNDASETVLRYAAESLQRSRVVLPRPVVDALLDMLPTARMSYARPPLITVLVNQRAAPDALAEAALPFALDGAAGIIPSAPLFEEVCVAARTALRACGAAVRPLVPRIEARLGGDEGQRRRALDLLALLPDVAPLTVPVLVEHLRTQRGPEEVEATLQTIGRLGEAALAAFPAVLACIVPDAHWRVTTAATRAAAAMGEVSRHACPAIEAVLGRREHQVLVLYAVAEMGPNAAPLRPFLARLAEQSDHREVRRLARELSERLT